MTAHKTIRALLFWTAIILALCLAGGAGAATYTIGSDPSDDYASLEAFHAAHTESPGDVISFRRGGQFYERLICNASGTSSQHIRYTAHGTGARPVFDVSHLFSSGDWSKTAGQTNVYQASFANAGELDTIWASTWGTVFEGSAYFSKQSSVGDVDTNAKSCYYDTDADILYINTTDSSSPITNGRDYRLPLYFSAVNTMGFDYIDIENIDFHFACVQACATWDFNTYPYEPSDHVTFTDMKGIATSHNLFAIIGTNIDLVRCESHLADGDNASFTIADLGDANQTVETANITLTDCIAGPTSISTTAAVKIESIEPFTGVTITGLTVTGNYSEAVSGWYDEGAINVSIDDVTVSGNVTNLISINKGTNYSVSGVSNSGTVATAGIFLNVVTGGSITGNHLTDCPTGVVVGASTGISTVYNIIKGGNVGINLSDGTGHLTANNTLSGQSTIGISAGATPCADATTRIVNNIFEDVPNGTAFVGTTLVCDYNIGHNLTYWGSNFDLATYRGFGLDLHSQVADPKFVDPDNEDFNLQASSPCIDAGTPVGLTTDYAGNGLRGLGVDIGVLEYQSGAVWETYTYKFQVRQSSDDVQVYRAAGFWPPNNSAALNATTVAIGSSTSLVNATAFRFATVRIPLGAVITSAKLKVYMNSTSAAGADEIVMVGFEQADNPVTYEASGANSPMTRIPAYVTAGEPDAVEWSLGVFAGDTWRYSPDLSTGLQHIIDGTHPTGWAQDNAVSVFVYPKVRNAFDDGGSHTIRSYDNVATYMRFAPQLIVTYESATAPTTNVYYLDSAAADGGDGLSAATAWNELTDLPITIGSGDTINVAAGSVFTGLLELMTDVYISKYGEGADPEFQGNGTGAGSLCIANNGTASSLSGVKLTTAQGGYSLIQQATSPRLTNVSSTNNYYGYYISPGILGYDAAGNSTDESVQYPTILNISSVGAKDGGTAGGGLRLAGRSSIKHLLVDGGYFEDGVDPIVAAGSTNLYSVAHEDWIIRNIRALNMTENVGLDAKGLDFPSYEEGLLVTDWEGSGDTGTVGGFSVHIGGKYQTYNRIKLYDLSGPAVSIHDDDGPTATGLTEHIRFSNVVAYNGDSYGLWSDGSIEGPIHFANISLYNFAGYGLNIGVKTDTTQTSYWSNILALDVGTGQTTSHQVAYTIDESKTVLNSIYTYTSADPTKKNWKADKTDHSGYEEIDDDTAMDRFGWLNLKAVDPLFVNAAGGNFRPRANSPAKDAGVAIDGRTTDASGGYMRGAAWDIGAYEAVYPSGGMGTGLGLGLN